MKKYNHWKQERVRAVCYHDSYIRLTPFFGLKVCLFGWVFAYSTHEGFSFKHKKRCR